MTAPDSTPGWIAWALLALTAVGGGGGAAALLLVRRQSRKLSADAAEVLSSAAVTLIGPLEDRLARTEAELGEQKQANRVMRGRLKLLEDQLDRIVTAILRPDVTVEDLRQLAGERYKREDTPWTR